MPHITLCYIILLRSFGIRAVIFNSMFGKKDWKWFEFYYIIVKHFRQELNSFSSKDLNLKKVGNGWSLVCKGYIYEKGEKPSMNDKKYLVIVVERTSVRPHKSV